MTKFIGYYIDDNMGAVPVATEVSRDRCMALTISRVLGMGYVDGSMNVQDRTIDISDEHFAVLEGKLDKYFNDQIGRRSDASV